MVQKVLQYLKENTANLLLILNVVVLLLIAPAGNPDHWNLCVKFFAFNWTNHIFTNKKCLFQGIILQKTSFSILEGVCTWYAFNEKFWSFFVTNFLLTFTFLLGFIIVKVITTFILTCFSTENLKFTNSHIESNVTTVIVFSHLWILLKQTFLSVFFPLVFWLNNKKNGKSKIHLNLCVTLL